MKAVAEVVGRVGGNQTSGPFHFVVVVFVSNPRNEKEFWMEI